MKNIFTLVLLILTACSVSAQKLGTFQKIDVGINGIGISIETPVADKVLLESAIGFGPSYDFDKEGGYGLTQKMNWSWALLEPSFYASAYGKFYYNREQRFINKKSLLLNSGNFIGVKLKYVSKSLSDPQFYSNTILANLNWGIQRNLGKHWTYSFSAGLGYGYNMDNSYGLFYPALDLKISYVLPFFSKK